MLVDDETAARAARAATIFSPADGWWPAQASEGGRAGRRQPEAAGGRSGSRNECGGWPRPVRMNSWLGLASLPFCLWKLVRLLLKFCVDFAHA